jgi:hypothetical protein
MTKVGACGNCGLNPGFGAQAPGAEIEQQTAADIMQVGEPARVSELCEFLCRRGGHEADLLEVGAMHRENRGRPVDHVLIIDEVSPVGRSDLLQHRAALSHDVGDAERSADLDQLTPRDKDSSTLGQRIEGEHQRAGRIVDRESILGSGQLREQGAAMIRSLASGARCKVVLQ